jgi:hypothetical protein
VAVKIIRQPDNFLLFGASKGFQLTVDCSKQLMLYNNAEESKLLDIDLRLADFSTTCDIVSLRLMIDTLIKSYGLQRRKVFNGDQFAPILAQHLDEIRSLLPATTSSIKDICDKFEEFRIRFSRDLERDEDHLLPDVSLSKLLHFVHPVSFWILDSRVNRVLDFWGYPESFSGFGSLLKDLFHDSEFEGFKTFLEQKNSQLVGNHPLNNLPCPFLKLLDKVLWSWATNKRKKSRQ